MNDMAIVKRIGLGLVAAILLFLVVGILLPSSRTVERSITIRVPMEIVFTNVNNLKNNVKWDSWTAEDPTLKYTYGEVFEGNGATCSWSSAKSGGGSMVIVESITNSYIKTEIDFKGKGKGKGLWLFKQVNGGVSVTQRYQNIVGRSLMGRYFNVFLDFMIGPYFEKGLANLKRVSEEENSQ